LIELEFLPSEMKLLTEKYKPNLSGIFLAIYLLSFVAGILHHHNYNFSSADTVEKGINLISNHFQIISGSNYECIIQQNLTSLQTAVIALFDNYQLVIEKNILFQKTNNQFDFNQFHLTDNLLRAPPALS